MFRTLDQHQPERARWLQVGIFYHRSFKLDTKEGEKTLYRLARQRHQAGKHVQQVRMMKDKDGNVMTDDESVLRIWKEYYMGLTNVENERERMENDGERVNLEVESVSKEEVRENMQMMKTPNAEGPDDMHTSGGMEMPRRECTEVPDETVQQNNGK